MPVDIDQRASAVARIDGSVGLYVDIRLRGIDLPPGGADHAHADRILQTHGAAESEDHLPLLQIVGIGQLKGGQIAGVNFQDSEVGQAIHAYQLRFHGAVHGSLRLVRILLVQALQSDVNLPGAFDHVRVGDDVAVR